MIIIMIIIRSPLGVVVKVVEVLLLVVVVVEEVVEVVEVVEEVVVIVVVVVVVVDAPSEADSLELGGAKPQLWTLRTGQANNYYS